MKSINGEIILKYLLDKIKSKYPEFKGIYLYGSRARDSYNAESDYDIVLVFNRKVDSELEKQILSIIYKYEIENEILIDFYCYDERDIINTITPFRQNVLKEGIFYAA